MGVVHPVLAGRHAVGHRWDGVSEWAQLDLAELEDPVVGELQPDPGVELYRGLDLALLFDEAAAYWSDGFEAALITPERAWNEAHAAIPAQLALTMNRGAPDVAVVNYNVFNRDAVRTINVFQKVGRLDLAAEAIDSLVSRPFSGRSYPEVDNPGQVLWIVGEQLRLAPSRSWMERVYPSVRQIAAMIRYYRTTPPPHWVSLSSNEFGDELPQSQRRELIAGRVDGDHPEFAEAFDVAGLRAAAELAARLSHGDDEAKWSDLADTLLEAYSLRFTEDLPYGYGSYCVLWPCELYSTGSAETMQFASIGAQSPAAWHYFQLARAHQGLLAGNREAASETLRLHLEMDSMRGWYLLDEGGESGSGGWSRARTTWDGAVAMPHAWAIAELWLLLRDSLVHESGGRLVLLAGVPAAWFDGQQAIEVKRWPTRFGPLTFSYSPSDGEVVIEGEPPSPPGGFVVRTPAGDVALAKGGEAHPPHPLSRVARECLSVLARRRIQGRPIS